MGTNEPVLDLNVLAPERSTIRLRTAGNPDGELWEFRHQTEMTIELSAEFQRLTTAIHEKALPEQFKKLTREEGRMMDQQVDEAMDIAMIRDDWREVGLQLWPKVAIVQAFIGTCFGVTAEQLAQLTEKQLEEKSEEMIREAGVAMPKPKTGRK